jgi:hypothetical protein
MEQSRQETRSGQADGRGVERALTDLVARMNEGGAHGHHHSILLRLSGPQGGMWTIESADGEHRLVTGSGAAAPRVEVHADAESIRRVLDGEVDGRMAFLSGGIMVRGDIAALERLSAALGTHVPSGA